jgi:large subunit ribosomal protein L23
MKPVNLKKLVTEKSALQESAGKITITVPKDANKIEIAKTVEKLYGVKVLSVRTSIMPKKTRLVSRGKTATKRPLTKKAIISLEKGKTIELNKTK